MEDRKLQGYWWLPTNSDKKLSGFIEFTDDGSIFLSIQGCFLQQTNPYDLESHEIILGVTYEGKHISLSKCSCINLNCPNLRTIQKKYRVTDAFLGIHYQNIQEMQFYKIVVEYDYLLDCASSGIPDFIEQSNSQQPVKNQNNLKLEANISKGKISVIAYVKTSAYLLDFHQTKHAQIIIDLASKDIDINEWYSSYLFSLQNFLTLATNEKNKITSISVYSRHKPYIIQGEEMPVQLISGIISQEQLKDKKSSQMLFTLKDIESHFSLCLQNWFNLSEEIKHICDIYFGLRYADFMYGELRFLLIVQALESYHRIKIESNYNSQDKQEEKILHKQKLEAIYDAVPEEHVSWLKSKLDFSHEISFKKRIDELARKHLKVIGSLVQDHNKFCKKVGYTRNYYTHYDQSLKNKAAQQDELFRLSQVLNYLLQSCILAELGFTSELSKSLVSKDGKYQYLINELKNNNFGW